MGTGRFQVHPTHHVLPEEITGYPFDPMGSWWSSIVPEASRNLIVNPSFEKWNALDIAIEYDFGGSGGTVGYVEFPDVGATAGRRCARIIFGGASRWIEYDEEVVVTPGIYSFSLDVHANLPNVRLQLTILDGVTTVAQKVIFTTEDGWQRLDLTYNEAGTGGRILRLTVVNTSPVGTIVHTDAWQFEEKPYSTTYLDGDMVGFFDLQPNQSFYWEGAAHASPSVRRKNTGAGGRLVAWSDEIGFFTSTIVGLGMGTIEPFTQILSDGTEIHRGSNLYIPRDFTITGRIYADNYTMLQRAMRQLTRLIRPNNTRDGAQQMLRYQQTDSKGRPKGLALDIVCVYRDGMSAAITNLYQQALAIQFHASQPYMVATGDSAAELSVSKLLYNNGIIFRDEDGDYINLSTDTFDAFIRRVAFDVQGRPLAVGPFTDIGGDSIEDVAYWDGTDWQQLGSSPAGGNLSVDGGWKFGFNTIVGITGNIREHQPLSDTWIDLDPVGVNGPINVVVRDVSGDIYAGGNFDDVPATGEPDFAEILKWDYVTELFEPLGGGLTHASLNASVSTILIHDGYVYVGGLFDEAQTTGMAGPAVAANNIARWSIAEETWDSMSSGFDDRVNKLLLGEDGFIYAIGDFEQDGGAAFDLRGIARWNGTSWEEPFILAHADGSYGADGADIDERGIIWLFHDIDVPGDQFDVSPTVGLSETFGWKNGVFYPSFVINSDGLQDLAIGPGNRVIFSILNLGAPATPAVMVPALNEVEYEGDADTPMIIHLNGEMQPYQIINLDTDGGVYFLPTLVVGINEEMVIRTDVQNSIMYSDGRPNLYRYMSAGPSSTKLLYLRPGINRVSIFADDETGSLAWLTWRNRHWGIEAAA